MIDNRLYEIINMLDIPLQSPRGNTIDGKLDSIILGIKDLVQQNDDKDSQLKQLTFSTLITSPTKRYLSLDINFTLLYIFKRV